MSDKNVKKYVRRCARKDVRTERQKDHKPYLRFPICESPSPRMHGRMLVSPVPKRFEYHAANFCVSCVWVSLPMLTYFSWSSWPSLRPKKFFWPFWTFLFCSLPFPPWEGLQPNLGSLNWLSCSIRQFVQLGFDQSFIYLTFHQLLANF